MRCKRLVLVTVLLAPVTAAPAVAGPTERVSVGPGGVEANGSSYSPSISADGRYVAFSSIASNLVSGDTNAVDVFVRDRKAGVTTRVSVGPGGVQGNDSSGNPSISADGRYVAFQSLATNLVPDGNYYMRRDIFVHDRKTGATTRVSFGTGNKWRATNSSDPSISASGRYVAFSSSATLPGDTNTKRDVFVHDLKTGRNTRVSVGTGGVQGDWHSDNPSISANGRYVVFTSASTNLVPGDTNSENYEDNDVFVHDLKTGVTTRVSVGTGGIQANDSSEGYPSISADGRYVAFASEATNLVPGDTNNARDIFVHDGKTGVTTRVSVGTGGVEADWISSSPSISAEGRYVVFESEAANLVAGDTNSTADVFVHDRKTGKTTRVNLGPGGVQANGISYEPSISANGRIVGFLSLASNLVPGDASDHQDVFVRQWNDNR